MWAQTRQVPEAVLKIPPPSPQEGLQLPLLLCSGLLSPSRWGRARRAGPGRAHCLLSLCSSPCAAAAAVSLPPATRPTPALPSSRSAGPDSPPPPHQVWGLRPTPQPGLRALRVAPAERGLRGREPGQGWSMASETAVAGPALGQLHTGCPEHPKIGPQIQNRILTFLMGKSGLVGGLGSCSLGRARLPQELLGARSWGLRLGDTARWWTGGGHRSKRPHTEPCLVLFLEEPE